MIRGKKIVFRCNGDSQIGWGHVKRCLNLAQWLRGKYKIYFVINQDPLVCEHIKEKGFPVFEISEKGADEKVNEKIVNTILGFEPHIVVNDIHDTTYEYMHSLKTHNVKCVNFDDMSKNTKMAHVVVDANRKEKEGKCFGPAYIVLSSIYPKLAKKSRKVHQKVKTILFSFGGSDPSNLTEKALRSLEDRIPPNIELLVTVGPSFQNKAQLEKWGEKYNVVLLPDVGELAHLLLDVDMAIVSGGTTMYESLSLGTPTVVMAQNKAEAKNARRMEKKGAVMYLGEGPKISDKKIMRKVNALINDHPMREKISAKAKATIDGKGLFRILEQIELCM
jgi:UDP-2,4-diacetamido-2,4,6-trideoxy-beta-L-altropyranose hydrolase